MSNRRKHPKSTSDVELGPDGWQRFETAISAAVKSGPQHRTGIKPSALKKTARPKRR